MEQSEVESRILNQANRLGAQEAESFFLTKRLITVRMANNQILESKGITDRGVGVRVVKDQAIGFTFTSNVEKESVERTVQDAFTAARVRGPTKHWGSLPTPRKANPIPRTFDQEIADIDTDYAVNIAIRMLDAASNQSPKITDVSGSLNLVFDNVRITNSHGVDAAEKSTAIFGSVTTEAEDNASKSSGVGFQGKRILKDFQPERVGQESAEMAVDSLGASKTEAGEYSLILEPFALAEIMSYVFAGAVISKSYQDKVSCFHGKIGEQIADTNLSIYDDPTLPECLGSTAFDDEGVPTQRLPIVEKGIFKTLLYDTFYGSKDKKPSTGSGRRSELLPGRSYKSIPFPEPHNFVIGKGDQTRDRLIEDTKRGILVGRIWYTYPLNPERGDFSTTTRSGAFLVEKGEIRKPISPMRIFDNLPKCLKNVGSIADNVKQVAPWFGYFLVAPTLQFNKVKATPT